jgi:hypothetical protein
MYENGKMRPVETIPGMMGGEIKEIDGGGGFNYDNFGKYHSVPPQYNNNFKNCIYHFVLISLAIASHMATSECRWVLYHSHRRECRWGLHYFHRIFGKQ